MRAIAPWIMVIVAVTFVGWMVFEVGMDIGGRSSGGASEEVARVNGRKIEYQTFIAAVQNAQEMQRQQGIPAPTTLEERRQLEDQVMDQMVQEIALGQEYKKRHITVSDREVRDALLNSPLPELQQIPEFQTDGQFDLEKYQRYLRSQADPNFNLALEARYREEIPRLKFFDQVTTDVYVSDAKLWQIYQDQHDSASADVLTIVPQVAVRADSIHLTDAELTAYYDAHRSDFERPAEAFLSFVALSRRPEASDSAASKQHVDEVWQEIADGADFAEVAKRESADSVSRDKGGDLGDVPLGTFVKPFEEAALKLRPGQVSQPVLTQFGWHIIKMQSKTDSTLHVSHILIPVQLYGDHLHTVDRKADSLDLYAAEIDDPATFDTVAAELGLHVAQAPPLEQGTRLQLGRFVIPDVHIWAFENTPGRTSQVIETDWAYYVFRVDSLRAAAVPPLADVRDQVERAAVIDRQWADARALATRVKEAIAGGLDLQQVGDSFGLRVQKVGPFTRLNPGPILQGAPEAIGAAFGGRLAQPTGPYDTEYAIFFVEPLHWSFADQQAFQAAKDQLHATLIQQARQARLQLVLAAVRSEANVVDRREQIAEEQAKAQRAAGTQPGQ